MAIVKVEDEKKSIEAFGGHLECLESKETMGPKSFILFYGIKSQVESEHNVFN